MLPRGPDVWQYEREGSLLAGFIVAPAHVDPVGIGPMRRALTDVNPGHLLPPQGELRLLSAIVQAVRKQRQKPDVPIVRAVVHHGAWGRAQPHEDRPGTLGLGHLCANSLLQTSV